MLIRRGKLHHLVEVGLHLVNGYEQPDIVFGQSIEDVLHAAAPVPLARLGWLPFYAEDLPQAHALEAHARPFVDELRCGLQRLLQYVIEHAWHGAHIDR